MLRLSNSRKLASPNGLTLESEQDWPSQLTPKSPVLRDLRSHLLSTCCSVSHPPPLLTPLSVQPLSTRQPDLLPWHQAQTRDGTALLAITTLPSDKQVMPTSRRRRPKYGVQYPLLHRIANKGDHRHSCEVRGLIVHLVALVLQDPKREWCLVPASEPGRGWSNQGLSLLNLCLRMESPQTTLLTAVLRARGGTGQNKASSSAPTGPVTW